MTSGHAKPYRLRSVLFVPASNSRALAKAHDLRPDALIFDLEDAVGPDEKVAALAALTQALSEGGFAAPCLTVRINIESAPDIIAALTVFMRNEVISAIVVPKVSSAVDIEAVAALLPPGCALWAMIETAKALVNLRDIVAVSDRSPLTALILGPNDLRSQLKAGSTPDRLEMSYALGMVVAHARAYGLLALDGVYNAFKDADGFVEECLQGKGFGFDGKTLIHPSQIAPANAVFGPAQSEIEWARQIVAAFSLPENVGAGVLSVGGEMVERMHLLRAQDILNIPRV